MLAVIAAAAVGYAPTKAHWGAEGIESMFAVAAICLGTALVPTVLMALIAARWPEHLGQAAFAGTGLRLLMTMAGLIVYQVLATPQLNAFLFWATVFYLLLLAIETPFAVFAVRRHHRAPPNNKEGAAS
ncbi:MAG: hypothetical protein ACE5E1_03520 [Phycisphaerae bacterium]